MKKILSLAFATTMLLATVNVNAQTDKSKRASPPAKVTQKIESGATITIDYSQPSIKGRTIGKDLEPMDGKIWRTGANEATIFETDKDLTIQGQTLPAGKYSLFTIFNKKEVTVIFNKDITLRGTNDYKESEDQLRIKAKVSSKKDAIETMTFKISPKGDVNLYWGKMNVMFKVK